MNFDTAIEGLPPELACRCRLALSQKEAAVEALARDGDTPLTQAGLRAALDEIESCIAVLSEFSPRSRETT